MLVLIPIVCQSLERDPYFFQHVLWQLYFPLVIEMFPTRESPGSLLPSEVNVPILPSFHNPPWQHLHFMHLQRAATGLPAQVSTCCCRGSSHLHPQIWQQGSQGATAQPRAGVLVGPSTRGHPREVAPLLALWCWAQSGCSYVHPRSRYPRPQG